MRAIACTLVLVAASCSSFEDIAPPGSGFGDRLVSLRTTLGQFGKLEAAHAARLSDSVERGVSSEARRLGLFLETFEYLLAREQRVGGR